MAAQEKADWPDWVGTRHPPFQLRCWKAEVEDSLLRSSCSSPSS